MDGISGIAYNCKKFAEFLTVSNIETNLEKDFVTN